MVVQLFFFRALLPIYLYIYMYVFQNNYSSIESVISVKTPDEHDTSTQEVKACA